VRGEKWKGVREAAAEPRRWVAASSYIPRLLLFRPSLPSLRDGAEAGGQVFDTAAASCPASSAPRGTPMLLGSFGSLPSVS
jgi:hypothetical protein